MRLRAPHGRLAGGFAATLSAVLLAGATLTGAAHAEPEVTAEDVEAAFHKVEVVSEQVNQLTEDLKTTKAQIADLNEEIAAQQVTYDRQRDALGAAIVQQQLDAPLGPTVNLFGSEDPEEFLEGLGAVQALNTTRSEALESFATTADQLRNRRAQVEERRAALEKDAEELRAKEQKMREGYRAAKAKLESLSAPEQEAINSSDTEPDAPIDLSASGLGGKAIQFASAQLGDPYVYGGTGPDGWDCSGLVQGSFAAAGASLPRVVGAQYQASRPIPFSQVQPGDIVFYGDMSHNGIYIGNGQVIHAPRPGKTVEVTSLSYGFSKAGRVG